MFAAGTTCTIRIWDMIFLHRGTHRAPPSSPTPPAAPNGTVSAPEMRCTVEVEAGSTEKAPSSSTTLMALDDGSMPSAVVLRQGSSPVPSEIFWAPVSLACVAGVLWLSDPLMQYPLLSLNFALCIGVKLLAFFVELNCFLGIQFGALNWILSRWRPTTVAWDHSGISFVTYAGIGSVEWSQIRGFGYQLSVGSLVIQTTNNRAIHVNLAGFDRRVREQLADELLARTGLLRRRQFIPISLLQPWLYYGDVEPRRRQKQLPATGQIRIAGSASPTLTVDVPALQEDR